MEDTENLSNSWLTTDGKIINPNAPAGGGGSGGFRAAGTLGVDEPFTPTLPPPGSPSARSLVTPDPLDASSTPKNPAPATPTGMTPLRGVPNAISDIDVKVEVLADGTNSSEPGQAHTKVETGSVKATYPNIFVDDATRKITKFTSRFTLQGTATIQIRYRPGVDKNKDSAYGRGTTLPDQQAGDVSVGFHEVCHVKDMLAWMKANPLPEFKVKVGMTESEFDATTAAYDKALDDYFERASENSHRLTDEIGSPTRSQWLATNQPP